MRKPLISLRCLHATKIRVSCEEAHLSLVQISKYINHEITSLFLSIRLDRRYYTQKTFEMVPIAHVPLVVLSIIKQSNAL